MCASQNVQTLNPAITLVWHDIYKFAGVPPELLDKCHQLSLSQNVNRDAHSAFS